MFGRIVGSFTPFTPDILGTGRLNIAELINPVTKGWDENVIQGLFWDIRVIDIMQIPLPLCGSDDVRVWHFTSHDIIP